MTRIQNRSDSWKRLVRFKTKRLWEMFLPTLDLGMIWIRMKQSSHQFPHPSDGHFPSILGDDILTPRNYLTCQGGLGVTTLSEEPSACHCKGYSFLRRRKKNQWNLTSFDFISFFEEWLLGYSKKHWKIFGSYTLPCFLIFDKSLDLGKDGLCSLNLEC